MRSRPVPPEAPRFRWGKWPAALGVLIGAIGLCAYAPAAGAAPTDGDGRTARLAAGPDECDDPANAAWIFCHDFEAVDAGKFEAYWDDIYGAGERMFLLDENPPGVPGRRSMRLQITNSADRALADGVTAGPKKFLGRDVDWDTIHYRRYMRFNADFHQGDFMHLGGLMACAASQYPWGCLGKAGQRPDGAISFSSNLEPWSDYQRLPWPGKWGFYSYYRQMYMDCGLPGPDDCYGDMFAPADDFFVSRGEWHSMEMAIDPGTPGVADGSQTYWVDGVRVFTAEGISWRTSADLRVNEAGVYLFIHNNPARTTNILDVDNVVFSRSYIGPAECEPGVEIEAACRCGADADPRSAAGVHTSGHCCDGVWRATPCGAPTPDPSDTPGPSQTPTQPLEPSVTPTFTPSRTPAGTPVEADVTLFLPGAFG